MLRLDLDTDNLVSRYLAGEPIRDIADGLGVSFGTIKRRIEESGTAIRSNSEAQRLRHGTPTFDAALAASEYVAGESENALASRFGVSRPVMRQALIEQGVTIRDQSVANACRMAKLSPEDRLRITKNAHSAIRGIPQSEEYRSKIALTRELRCTQTNAYERHLIGLLEARGLNPIPQKAIGRYNVDLALAESSVAVEVFGVKWHSHGRHPAMYRQRTDYILDRGWSLVVVWGNDLYPIGDGAADYIVSVHEARRPGEAGRGQEHVIWGNGHGGPVREG